MNWDAIGAIGEFLGAGGVIVSLLYLATQIKADAKARRGATFQELSSLMSAGAEAIHSGPFIAPLLVKMGKQEGPLTPEEQIRFHFFMLMACRRFEAVHVHKRLDLIDPELIEGFEYSNLSIVTGGAGAEWWSKNKAAFTRSFVDWVDTEIASGRAKPMHPGLGRPTAV